MKIRVTKPAETQDIDALVVLTRDGAGQVVHRVRLGDHTTERQATPAEAQFFNDALAAELLALGWTREADPPPESAAVTIPEPTEAPTR